MIVVNRFLGCADAGSIPAISTRQATKGAILTTPHQHRDEYGVWQKCYHQSRALLTNWQFWLGLTLGFPLEHLIYERLWPFYLITHWLGL